MNRKIGMGFLALALVAFPYAVAADVAELSKKLKDPDNDVRRGAAKELAGMGPEAKSALPILVAATKDRDLFVRRYAAEALGEIGPSGAKSSVPALRVLLRDGHKEVQEAAVFSLGKMGPEGVSDLALVVRDSSREPAVRMRAAEALGRMGKSAKSSVPALTSALKNSGPQGKAARRGGQDDLRAEIARALGETATKNDKAAIAELQEIVDSRSRNRDLKRVAGEALRKITGEKVVRPKKKK